MPRVTIWTIESDYDKEAVKLLAHKLATHQKTNLAIRAVGRKVFSDVTSKTKKDPDALGKAVNNYLRDGDSCVIFVTDSDSPILLERKRQDTNSAISQIEQVTRKFAGRAHLALAIHELEAWLLVDCVGVCCYFAGVKNTSESRQKQAAKFQGILKNYSRGNTELIVEAEAGGKGPKEYLIELSEKILKSHNPKIVQRIITQKRYTESLSPEVANYIEINDDNLRRNASLQRFGEYLIGCSKAE